MHPGRTDSHRTADNHHVDYWEPASHYSRPKARTTSCFRFLWAAPVRPERRRTQAAESAKRWGKPIMAWFHYFCQSSGQKETKPILPSRPQRAVEQSRACFTELHSPEDGNGHSRVVPKASRKAYQKAGPLTHPASKCCQPKSNQE